MSRKTTPRRRPYCISEDGRLVAAAEALDAGSTALLEIFNLWVQRKEGGRKPQMNAKTAKKKP